MEKSIIVQSDFSILLDTTSESSEEARQVVSLFSDLVKAPEYIHTYKITPLSIWNAMELGYSAESIADALLRHSKFQIPPRVFEEIASICGRYGKCKLYRDDGQLRIKVDCHEAASTLEGLEMTSRFLENKLSPGVYLVHNHQRGELKKALIESGFPAKDIAGFDPGENLSLDLLETQKNGDAFNLRDYQSQAIRSFYVQGADDLGHGVILLPCGAGKTIVGLGVMQQIQEQTLILTTGRSSVMQWKREILLKTSLNEHQVAEYSSSEKKLAPVTISTYQMMSHRKSKDSDSFPNFDLFTERNWGLIIYDEIHLLPAPIFRVTAKIQAKKRLGLTATLIREDGRERDVFALIGPKRYEVPWRSLEDVGYIASASCTEIRVPMPEPVKINYCTATARNRFRIAAENPEKNTVLKNLISDEDSKFIIIGEYLSQLEKIAKEIKFPIITGKTKQEERDRLYDQFRIGKVRGLILSRVGNFAIDLPDANVLVQVSGKFGSRQEEAQRLGRILRPKSDNSRSRFYTLVSSGSCEERFARNRQIFLAEQGYEYDIKEASRI